MWLYRDRASPFYSPVGATENERPILAGGSPRSSATRVSGCRSTTWRARLLPIYNFIDGSLYELAIMRLFRPFVLTGGEKLT